jgi:hypothetical protein
VTTGEGQTADRSSSRKRYSLLLLSWRDRARGQISQISASGVITAVLVLAITWVSWHSVNFVGIVGLDSSWQAGIEMATHQGLSFGREVVFTYGPLGFLSDQPSTWFSSLGVLGFLYLLFERIAVSAALFLGARQAFGRSVWGTAAAALLAALVASLIGDFAETGVLMVVAAWALRSRVEGRRAQVLAALLGAATAVELMNKISVGVAFLLMTTVLLIALPQRRWSVVLTGGGTAVVVFIVLWLVLGQPITAIPDYVRASIEISGGYTPAMSADEPGADWIYLVYFALLAAGLWVAWDSTEGGPRRQRIGLMLVWLLFWFFGFKEAVVRDHYALFVEGLLIAWLGFGRAPGQRLRDSWFRAAAGTTVLTGALLALQGSSLTRALDPGAAVSAAVDNIHTAFSPALRGRAINTARIQIQAGEGIDPTTLGLLRGHTVSVFPNESAAAWAYRLRWDPIPVLQSYSAYTPWLDRLDANFLASARAPQRILIAYAGTSPSQSVDDRILGFDEPETTRELLCRYRPIHTTARWAVLALGPSRCSTTQRLVATFQVGWGQAVPVPPPPTAHAMVIARISGAAPHGLESLWSFLFKPGRRYIILGSTEYRFVSANEADGLVVRSGPGFDYPKPFDLVPQSADLGVAKVGESLGGRPITIRFYVETYTGP